MKKYLSLFFLLAVVGFSCQDQSEDVMPSAASAPNKDKSPKGQMDMLTLSETGATQVSITITVTAGSTGAPAGFSLQWMTKEAYGMYGWDSNAPGYCQASFSGNANLSRYNLAAGQSVSVKVGEFLFDNGASTNCGDMLECGTEYVFRSFAHANSSLQRSAFSGDYMASTLNCTTSETCTYTQGYWKNHGPEGCASGNNTNMWPVRESLTTLGGVDYTDEILCSLLNTPAAGNAYLALAHQLIAAKLNVANGADATDVAALILAADAVLAGKVLPAASAKSSEAISALIDGLADYNEGATGPGHCN
ncbi:hypothetical protein [Cesiribacter andamanensis]|uniref:Uncharacterized protein n=1 Tax=Cesiribacter andamanensis AMV16 TaxID=1279009 RepID=M7N107_9BACT|nr:hypothetical protein [Cesiribacter andamanensis]EMR00891.1 hypothetical protein ADICEAN_03991 [Cesiribacter andamanensis AMV16]